MQRIDNGLLTPIYVAADVKDVWPAESAFYLLAGNDLFLARRHAFFQSCVPAPRWPAELPQQQTFFRPAYPLLGQRALECIVGFFDYAYRQHGAESVVLLAWDAIRQRVRVVVPSQRATSSVNVWGDVLPMSVRYEMPANLPAGLAIFGDVHSHCNMAAYASGVDCDDERHTSGMLHAVAGRVDREPPEWHLEAVVDGRRFKLAPEQVFVGYHRRRARFPVAWRAQLQVEYWRPTNYSHHSKPSSH